ncbi:uncharacterized protein LOC143298501 [Babylonia areolata]|uniref:uncharacterized protein LOC143298501 n=1 Tax=Babylonia areolata TaxID=304850 RepID=UPI003FD3087C
MRITSGLVVISWMLRTVIADASDDVPGPICCGFRGTTVDCTQNVATSCSRSLCEILFPSQTCPGEEPRKDVTKLLLDSTGLRNISKYTLHRLSRLQVLDLRNNLLSAFPRNQNGWLPSSVVELYLSHNYLDVLPRYAFRGLVRLVTLCINNNHISMLSAGTFAGNPQLKKLDLSFNRLQTITPGVFQRLKMLTSLNLNNNYLKTLSETAFSSLAHLKFLSLKSNHLTIIPGTVLRPLINLETLTLKNNLLYELDISSLVSTNQISYLDVSANFLSFNNATFLDGANLYFQTTMIIVVSNYLKTLKISSAFKPSARLPPFVEFRPSINSLQSLDVSYTSFATCSLTFLGLEGLASLNISGGYCVEISDIVFNYLPNLRNLSMSSMCVDASSFRKQSRRLFNKLTKLEHLDLSRNDLYSLDPRMLSGQTRLKTLNLAWNRFQSLPVELGHLKELTVLDLSHNMLITLHARERMTLDSLVRMVSLSLHSNPFPCSCSSAGFFHWWIHTPVSPLRASRRRLEAREDQYGMMQCVNNSGEAMSVMQVIETCPIVSHRLFTGFSVFATLSPLLLVLLAMAVTITVKKGWGCCRCRRPGKQRRRRRRRTTSTGSDTVVALMQTDSSESFPAARKRHRNDQIPQRHLYQCVAVADSDEESDNSALGQGRSPTRSDSQPLLLQGPQHSDIHVTADTETRRRRSPVRSPSPPFSRYESDTEVKAAYPPLQTMRKDGLFAGPVRGFAELPRDRFHSGGGDETNGEGFFMDVLNPSNLSMASQLSQTPPDTMGSGFFLRVENSPSVSTRFSVQTDDCSLDSMTPLLSDQSHRTGQESGHFAANSLPDNTSPSSLETASSFQSAHSDPVFSFQSARTVPSRNNSMLSFHTAPSDSFTDR